MSGIVGEIQIGSMKPTAELKGDLPPSVPPTANLPPPLDDNAVKAAFQEAAKLGIEDMNAPVPTALPGQPPTQIPDKFKRPDGTVDEEKLKNSSQALDEAIQAKQKSIDEILSDYKEKQKAFTQISQQKANLERQVPQVPSPPAQQPIDPMALQNQIVQDYQRDPIQTTIMLTQAIMQKELSQRLAPIEQGLQSWQENQRDNQLRQNLAQLAHNDPRILDSRYYGLMQQILADDPEMYRLRNPHKAAWNEVKERLRLGDPQGSAQPSTNPSPMLGQGAPPFVSKVTNSLTPQALRQEVDNVNPLSQEAKQIEERLREATRDLWQY